MNPKEAQRLAHDIANRMIKKFSWSEVHRIQIGAVAYCYAFDCMIDGNSFLATYNATIEEIRGIFV